MNTQTDKTPVRLVLDANGEYKVRSNTGEGSDKFIMDLLDGVEVLTNYKGINEWYQWKPSQNMTDKDGDWVKCGNGMDSYEEYVDRNKDDLTIIDLRVATISNYGVNTNTHDVVHHPKHYTEDPSGKVCSDGGSSSYYFTKLPEHLIDEINRTGGIEIKDIVRYVYDNNADAFNIIKAQKRIIEDLKGAGKMGVDSKYDAKKIIFFAEEQFKHLTYKE